jgi:hypothetical protein
MVFVPEGNERDPARRRRGVLGLAAALALVGVYLGIAAAAHLTPWRAASSSAASSSDSPASPAPPSIQAASGSTGPASATAGPSVPSAAQALLDLIPGGVRAHGCPAGHLALGAIAVRDCSDVSYGPGKPGAVVTYYLFGDNNAMGRAYADFLTASHVRQGTGNCGDFRAFSPPCETAIKNANPVMTGRAMEFTHAGAADIVSSDEQRHVIVYITARDGQALVKWWVRPDQWLVTG